MAYKLPSGRTVQTTTPDQVKLAIQQASGAHRTGSELDDEGLRAHLVDRALITDQRHLLPASFGQEHAQRQAKAKVRETATMAGKSLSEIYDMAVSRVDGVLNPANGTGFLLAKSAAAAPPPKWADWPEVASQTRDAIYDVAKANGCKVTSIDIDMTTPAEAHEALKKAAAYQEQAERLIDRGSADAYRALARKTLKEAGLDQ